MRLIKISPIKYINPYHVSSITEILASSGSAKTVTMIKMHNGDLHESSTYVQDLISQIEYPNSELCKGG